MDEPPRRTLATEVVCEVDRIRGSRFVAHLAPAPSVGAAREVVERVRSAFPDASHHCWAWRMHDGTEQAGDDGEPHGTAGAPILRHLAGADLVDVVAVVVRWFGGTKLGRGGLVRAYGDATAAAIAEAEVLVHVATATVDLAHGYEDTGAVDGVLHRHDAEVVAEEYATGVTRRVRVVAAAEASLRRELREATAGRIGLPGDDGP